MICAYEQIYLERARTNLGRMLNFGVHELGRELSEFYGAFIASGVASRFGQGNVRLIAGMSGVEYWSGWALA